MSQSSAEIRSISDRDYAYLFFNSVISADFSWKLNFLWAQIRNCLRNVFISFAIGSLRKCAKLPNIAKTIFSFFPKFNARIRKKVGGRNIFLNLRTVTFCSVRLFQTEILFCEATPIKANGKNILQKCFKWTRLGRICAELWPRYLRVLI